MGLIALRENLHNKMLKMRNLEVIMGSAKFERLWKDSDPVQQDAVQQLIHDLNGPAIREWMRKHPSLELGEQPLYRLREIAKRRNILNYSRKAKGELITILQKEEEQDG